MFGKNGRLILTLNGEPVAEETIVFGKDGEQRVPLRLKTNVAGEFDLRVHVAARDDETDPGNNQASRRLRVVDDKIRVLFVEQAPRWDYRYLQAVLMRDRRVEVKTLLLEGDPSIAREENSPYLEKFPNTKKELFEYDVVVFGDVDPNRISTSQMENLNEFVSRFGLQPGSRLRRPWALPTGPSPMVRALRRKLRQHHVTTGQAALTDCPFVVLRRSPASGDTCDTFFQWRGRNRAGRDDTWPARAQHQPATSWPSPAC